MVNTFMNNEDQDFLCQYAAAAGLSNKDFSSAYRDIKDLFRIRRQKFTKSALYEVVDSLLKTERIKDNLDVLECKGTLRKMWDREFGNVSE